MKKIDFHLMVLIFQDFNDFSSVNTDYLPRLLNNLLESRKCKMPRETETLQKCPKCSYQSDKLFNFNRYVRQCGGVKPEHEKITGSSLLSCNKCLPPVSSKDALRRHQLTESCVKRRQWSSQKILPRL